MTDSILPPDQGTPAPQPIPPEKKILDDLVGEGKKYKDPEILARAALEKDRFIEQLKSETSGLRAELAQAVRLLEIKETLEKPEPPAPVTTPTEGVQKTVQPEEIQKIVQDALLQDRTESVKARNRSEVVAELTKLYGTDYPAVLREKLKSLDMTEKDANELAAVKPKALLALVKKEEVVKDDVFAPPRSTVNTTFQPVSGTPTMDSYEAMRRSADPKVRAQYWSPAVQNEIHKKGIEAVSRGQPEAFFGK